MDKLDQFRTLLKKLYQKTIENKVFWRALEYGYSFDYKAFRVEFANGSNVTLVYMAPGRGPDIVEANYQVKDRVLERLFTEDGSEEFDFLWELILEAERCVTGWDKLLEESVEELDADGMVGVNAGNPEYAKPAPVPGGSR